MFISFKSLIINKKLFKPNQSFNIAFFRLGECTKTNLTTNLKNLPPNVQIIDDQVHNFPNESKKYTLVDDNSFQVMNNGSLNVTLANGDSKIIQQNDADGKSQYCLEYVTEKCNYTSLTW